MDIRPIFVSLYKHLTPALLIVLEIALAYAVLCNAVFMISQRIATIHMPNAIDESGISVVTLQGADPQRVTADTTRNLAALRRLAGVTGATVTSSVPLDGQVTVMGFTTTPEGKSSVNSSEYFISNSGEQALGLRLLQGRFFNETDYSDSGRQDFLSTGHVTLVTQSDALRLWPGQSPLGETLYSDGGSWTVVGVVGDVLGQDPTVSSDDGRYSSMFFPLHPDEALTTYVIRSTPEDRQRIVSEAVQTLNDLEPTAVVNGETYAAKRDEYFTTNRSMVWILVLVCAVMLAVNAFGIVGLTSFWVQQRHRQIGIRRALGATRYHILQYFQTENLLLTAVGVATGAALAYSINAYLMHHYEMDRMPWYYLLFSMIALVTLGQVAVLGTALRAAAVPPLVATRRA